MLIYRYIAEVLFFLFIVLTFFGGILAVRSKLLIHSVLGLAVCFIGVAGLYFYLGSPFLSMMQILIYVGAICIVLVFGVMVGYTPTEVAEKNLKGKNLLLAIVSCTTVFSLMTITVFKSDFTPSIEKAGDFSMLWLGRKLIYDYCLAFELISLVLLAAIIGSIILGQGGRGDD
ncbi:MAG: NADH-quinone oxidoreductase subunit J [Deltaproteobacteria bacterium]|nr:MAG: NADH-quinone oxidoreductase subunit J [Deltaproteobacteria bacterium]